MARVTFAVLFLLLCIYEGANLTGYSWKRHQVVPERELIDAAIRYSYPGIYANAQELRRDYASFRPEVRYWGSWTWSVENGVFEKLLGLTNYQVRLPEEIVMVSKDGVAQFSRGDSSCGGDGPCPPTQPDRPERGIVGTVQDGPPDFAVSSDFTLAWKNQEGGQLFKSGHCFAAAIVTPESTQLRITLANGDERTVRTGYGYYLVSVRSDAQARMRISKAMFERSRRCSDEARQAWPNVGGVAWKR